MERLEECSFAASVKLQMATLDPDDLDWLVVNYKDWNNSGYRLNRKSLVGWRDWMDLIKGRKER